eukprot:1045019-Pyramimonas_sp.AAC.1
MAPAERRGAAGSDQSLHRVFVRPRAQRPPRERGILSGALNSSFATMDDHSDIANYDILAD